MAGKAGILSFLMVFNVNVAYGVDIVVKIDKYAPLTGDCDTAITNVEVILSLCRLLRGNSLKKFNKMSFPTRWTFV